MAEEFPQEESPLLIMEILDQLLLSMQALPLPEKEELTLHIRDTYETYISYEPIFPTQPDKPEHEKSSERDPHRFKERRPDLNLNRFEKYNDKNKLALLLSIYENLVQPVQLQQHVFVLAAQSDVPNIILVDDREKTEAPVLHVDDNTFSTLIQAFEKIGRYLFTNFDMNDFI